MKICILIDSMVVPAGLERFVSVITGLWLDSGHEVVLLTKDNRKSFYPLHKDIQLETLNYESKIMVGSKLKKSFYIVHEFIKLNTKLYNKIEEIKPDYIYCGTAINTFLTYITFRKKYKVIAAEHGAYSAQHKVYKILKRIIYPKVYAVVSLTNTDMQKYLKINKNSYCVPNPLPMKVELKADLKSKQVIAVGRLIPQKGYDYMLAVWELIVKKHPDWKLRIFGKGYLKESLQKTINDKKIHNSTFLSGISANILEEYVKSSIFLMTAINEGLPMALLEAMECGLPVVSFNTPEGPKEILDGSNGLISACYDVEDLATNLCRMIEDESLRYYYSERSINKSRDYNPEAISRLWNNVFQ